MKRKPEIDNNDEPRTSTLRTRRQRTTSNHVNQDMETIVFGDAHANAYFTAQRLKNAERIATSLPTQSNEKKPLAKGRKRSAIRASNAQQEEDEEIKDESGDINSESTRNENRTEYKMLSMNDLLQSLLKADTLEDRLRATNSDLSWPTFDHLYPVWNAHLQAGSNILLHGMGSKRILLEAFGEYLPRHVCVADYKGYVQELRFRDQLHKLLRQLYPSIQLPKSSRGLITQCQAVVEHIEVLVARKRSPPPLYIIIHALDGSSLRDAELQSSIAVLSTSPFIHLIASIENVNASMLWSELDALRFQWIYYQVDTLRPYGPEMDVRLVRQSKHAEQTVSGVAYTMLSLTPTDVSTLQIIANQQLLTIKTPRSNSNKAKVKSRTVIMGGADQITVYQACRERLLHSSMQSFNNSIKCLVDNRLLLRKRTRAGDTLVIPLSCDIIRSDILREDVNNTS